jgi:hypothetical protein
MAALIDRIDFLEARFSHLQLKVSNAASEAKLARETNGSAER